MMSPHLQSFLTSPLAPVHICPIWLTQTPPVYADTNFEYDAEFFRKSSTPDTYLYEPSPR